MLSTDSISKVQSSTSSFTGSINKRPRSEGISMVETTLRVTELCFSELDKSFQHFKDHREFANMDRDKNYISMGSDDGADDGSAKTALVPPLPSSSSKLIRPTPLDFAHFLPWLCAEWQSPQFAIVTSVVKEDYVSVIKEHQSLKSSRGSSKFKSKHKAAAIKIKEESLWDIMSKLSQWSLIDVPLVLTATFDSKSRLVEITIAEREIEIHRKTIQAISVCIPFHCMLTRLTLRWARLNNILIYEIGKLLPNSYLTDIVLDDTRGHPNYEMLLSKESPLKYLSLNRCGINNDQCKKIAANIEYGSAGAHLHVLELGSNFITDEGALAIAESLRRNRSLMHLNLSGNMITDEGAIPLLSNLMKFKLRPNEIMESKKRKQRYIQKKLETYESCYKEVMLKRQLEENQKKGRKNQKHDNRSNKKYKRRASPLSSFDDGKDEYNEVTELTLQIVGEFSDPFNDQTTISENDCTYCTGNLVLCSLNLSYNNLTHFSIPKIHEVLKYQNEVMTSAGLKRIVFNGNKLPLDYNIYSEITNYLQNNVTAALQKTRLKERPLKDKSSKIKMV